MTRYPICGIIRLAFAGVAHLVERDLAKVEVASSSLVARSKKETPSVRMVFSFWNVAGRAELAASTCAKRVKSRGKGRVPANGSAIRGMPGASRASSPAPKKKHHPSGWCFLFGMSRAGLNSLPRPARSALNPEVKAGFLRMALPFAGCRERVRASSPAPKITTLKGGDFFRVLLGLQFLLCKNWTAQARSLTEREWGNPSKVPPSHSPFLAMDGAVHGRPARSALKPTSPLHSAPFARERSCLRRV